MGWWKVCFFCWLGGLRLYRARSFLGLVGTLTGNHKSRDPVKPHLVLMHAFYDTKGGIVSLCYGTAVVGGVPGHFATTNWNNEAGSILCPLGDKNGNSGQVTDALGLIATSNSQLYVVPLPALPDWSVEVHARHVAGFKAAVGVSAPGYSSGFVIVRGSVPQTARKFRSRKYSKYSK